MQAMIVAVQSNPRPFVLYPFRALDFLMKQIPNAVTHAWQQRFWRASCDVYLICELHGHWSFFAMVFGLSRAVDFNGPFTMDFDRARPFHGCSKSLESSQTS